jgi:hypothetical protein
MAGEIGASNRAQVRPTDITISWACQVVKEYLVFLKVNSAKAGLRTMNELHKTKGALINPFRLLIAYVNRCKQRMQLQKVGLSLAHFGMSRKVGSPETFVPHPPALRIKEVGAGLGGAKEMAWLDVCVEQDHRIEPLKLLAKVAERRSDNHHYGHKQPLNPERRANG